MKSVPLITGAVFLIFLEGCFSPSTKYTHSGFLENYDKLTENPKVKNSIIWVAPNIDKNPVKTIYIAPIVLRQQKSDDAKDFIDVSKGRFNTLSTDLHNALVTEFKKAGYIVSDNPPDAEQIRLAITGLTTVPEDVAIYELLPLMAIIDTSRSIAGYRSDEVYLFLETQFRSKNNIAQAEVVTYVTGVSMSPAALEDITPEQVQEQCQKFAENFVNHIDPVLQRKHSEE